MRLYHKRLSNFVEYLHDSGVCRLCDIAEDIIMSYVSMRENRQIEYVRSVKSLLIFLFTNELTDKNWSYAVKILGKKFKHVRASSFCTPDEIGNWKILFPAAVT